MFNEASFQLKKYIFDKYLPFIQNMINQSIIVVCIDFHFAAREYYANIIWQTIS